MKTAVTILLILLFIFFVFSALVRTTARSVISSKLEKSVGKKVTISDASLSLPFTLKVRGLEIEELGRVNYVYVSPSIFGLLTGRIAFNSIKLIGPEFSYTNKKPAAETQPASPPAPAAPPVSEAQTQPQPQAKEPGKLRLIIKRLIIKDGKFNFIDQKAGESGITIHVKDISLKVDNLYIFPVSEITRFELKGKIPWQEGQAEGKISAEGWLNLFKKDIQATFKIEDIDGVYLYPYYSYWVDLEKARIEKAKLNFISNIHGKNNDITADCHLELADIVRKSRAPEEKEEKAEKIAEVVFEIFRALDQGKIVLDFSVKTKMDYPQFDFSDIKTAVEEKVQLGLKERGSRIDQITALPANLVKNTARGFTGMFRAVVDSIINTGREYGGTFRKIIKPQKAPQENKTQEQ